MNFSFFTYEEIRTTTWEIIKRNFSSSESFCTDKCRKDVRETGPDEYDNFLCEVMDHHFVMCPRGNGIDTHRLWEILYTGRVPVVKRDNNSRYYEDLPILFVDSYEQVTREFLESKMPEFSDLSKFNLEKLKISWWKQKIAKDVSILCK
jgi:hypothetical protein